ncbi:MAG: hypothetical protein AMK71_10340 [Nitrospira bacterium SG8_35_4]|nr:MAG: hypothetical protein AMK71_10340 [Nitrospira bacterium SG8_35_4]
MLFSYFNALRLKSFLKVAQIHSSTVSPVWNFWGRVHYALSQIKFFPESTDNIEKRMGCELLNPMGRIKT